MRRAFYTVKNGDTLSQIAETYNTTPGELADLNSLDLQGYIFPGQTLLLPSSETLSDKPYDSLFEEDKKLWVEFQDSNEQYIAGLKVWISLNGVESEHVTDSRGRITVKKIETPAKVTVSVKKTDGGKKQVSEFEVALFESMMATLISPKLEYDVGMRRHDAKKPQETTKQPAPVKKQDPVSNKDSSPSTTKGTTVKRERNNNNHPQDNVQTDNCSPNKNFKLRKKDWDRYSTIILAASDSKGLEPYYVAAILNAEAASSNGCWKSGSANSGSSARGLTQFLGGTWNLYAKKPGSFLNKKANEKGWVKGKKILNRQAVLNMRYDPECSIYTGIEYAVDNLKTLQNAGYVVKNEGERAKLAYLGHHLGSSGAINFIQHDIDEPTAKYLLGRQFGKDKKTIAKKLAHYYELGGNSYVKGHRIFIEETIDRRVRIENFMCDSTKLGKVRGILKLCDDIKR